MSIWQDVLNLHIYSIYASRFLIIIYIFLTQYFVDEFKFIYRIRVFLPIYYMFLAFVCFTGILLLALKNFDISFYDIFMIFAWILILYLAIKNYKNFKKARKTKKYKIFSMTSSMILVLSFLLLFVPDLFRITYAIFVS